MFQNLRRMMSQASTLKIACACGHQVAWDRTTAFRRLGADATPYDARLRLTCTACGRARQARVWI